MAAYTLCVTVKAAKVQVYDQLARVGHIEIKDKRDQ